MLHFHVDLARVLGELELPHTQHLLAGQAVVPPATIEAIFSHPHLHDGAPAPPCPWVSEAPRGIATLAASDLAQLASDHGETVLAAVAACAAAAGGHVLVWRTDG